MSGVLDSIVRRVVLNGPETVSSNWESPSVSIDSIEAGFSVELQYDGGSSVDMKVYLQFSNDNINFATDTDSEIIITDDDGTCLFDVGDSSTLYCRVLITITGGNIDVQSINLAGRRRH